MYCYKCGKEIRDDSAFCQYCGTTIKSDEREAQTATAISNKKKKKPITLWIGLVVLLAGIICAAVIIPKQNAKKESNYHNAEVGDIITFGSYEQDNDTSNGKEDIEWQVLTIEDGKALLISRYALDCRKYKTGLRSVTWETSTLRRWLNEDFLKDAFTDTEKALIPTVTVTADKNRLYTVMTGMDTKDQVFLLSNVEAEKYFASDEDRMCVPTAYAVAQGVYTSSRYTVDGFATCWWWLRSPGCDSIRAAGISICGSIDYTGFTVDYDNGGVRPAMWINLDA